MLFYSTMQIHLLSTLVRSQIQCHSLCLLVCSPQELAVASIEVGSLCWQLAWVLTEFDANSGRRRLPLFAGLQSLMVASAIQALASLTPPSLSISGGGQEGFLCAEI